MLWTIYYFYQWTFIRVYECDFSYDKWNFMWSFIRDYKLINLHFGGDRTKEEEYPRNETKQNMPSEV